jgi:hypothetical protein
MVVVINQKQFSATAKKTTLADINSTLLSIKRDTAVTAKRLSGQGLSEEKAKEGLHERTKARDAIAKPTAPKAPSKNKGGGIVGKGVDWLKWFGVISLAVFFKDKILAFLAAAFEPLKDWVLKWWDNKFLPSLNKLAETVLGKDLMEFFFGNAEEKKKRELGLSSFWTELGADLKDLGVTIFGKDLMEYWFGGEGKKGAFATGWQTLNDFGVTLGNQLDTLSQDLLGFSLKDILLGEMGFDTEGKETGRSGGPFEKVSKYFSNVGDGIKEFGIGIGVLDKNGDVTFGGAVGLGAIGATLLTIVGPAAIITGLFGAFKSVTTGLLGLGIKGVKLPFKALGLAITGAKAATSGIAGAVKGFLTKLVVPKVPKVPKVRTTPSVARVPAPGSVVTSAAGNKVLAGADGKPTTIKPGDKVGKAAIMKAAKARVPTGLGGVQGLSSGPRMTMPSPPPKANKVTQKIADTGKKVGAAALKRFPNLIKALSFAGRIPGLSAVIGAGMIAKHAMDDSLSPKDKVAAIAGALGGIGGASGGALIGALAGGLATGPLAPVGIFLGGLSGALIGGYAGDTMFHGIAQHMLGMKVDAFPSSLFPFGMGPNLNDFFNKVPQKKYGKAGMSGQLGPGTGGTGDQAIGEEVPGFDLGVVAPPSTTGTKISKANLIAEQAVKAAPRRPAGRTAGAPPAVINNISTKQGDQVSAAHIYSGSNTKYRIYSSLGGVYGLPE